MGKGDRRKAVDRADKVMQLAKTPLPIRIKPYPSADAATFLAAAQSGAALGSHCEPIHYRSQLASLVPSDEGKDFFWLLS